MKFNKNQQEETNRKKYTIPSGASYQLRPKNAIYISPSNTLAHELHKCIGAYQLKRWGDIKTNSRIIELVKALQKEMKLLMKGFDRCNCSFITEAVPKIANGRRIDLVRLDPETWIEYETDKKINKGDCVTIHI